ncbi:hypothetical protein C8F01DRAFT_1110484 [Mycena amicta]|nr:hypothetical protein C8F01DRAFT_1110484 [Mycena amicta]
MPQIDFGDHQFKWVTENQRATHALFACIERADCAQNQTKVVILLNDEFTDALHGGYIGGEVIWALSTIRALEDLGYTLYHIFHNLVKMILANPNQLKACRDHPICLKSEKNPAGIPAWRLWSFYWWDDHQHENLLGTKWVLSPEDYGATHTYLGYSIEAQCALHPFIPHAERQRQAYILAKHLKYFDPKTTAWSADLYDAAVSKTGIKFIMAAETKDNPPNLEQISQNIHNFGDILSQEEFYGNLSSSVVLVGVGMPLISPTPYDALCLGVPFVNVVKEWDKSNPEDRSRWETQQGALRSLSEPYV